MGVLTDGQICYGILFPKDTEFPWDKFDGEIKSWWTFEILGFRHSFEMFTSEGEWIGGEAWPDDKCDAYDQEQRDFESTHDKLPIELVNCCSANYPIWILALTETCTSARRGYPERFDPAELTVSDEQTQILIEFCHKFGIEFEGEPHWYLSSYWG